MIDENQGAVLLVNKPLFWTSFEVVNAFKHQVKPFKIGHAGTLDPMASGLLILCTGKQTKIIESIQSLPKTYSGTIKFGAITAGYDLEAKEENIYKGLPIEFEKIIDMSKEFIGDILQKPPVFSAVKIGGKRAYKLGREGVETIIKEKSVSIYEFKLTNYHWPYIDFEVHCSKGTYIRSLAFDLGRILGCGAYLTKLNRTQIGDYKLDDANNELIGQTTAKSRILREKVEALHPTLLFH